MAVCQPAACPGSLNPALPCSYIPTYSLHDSQRYHCFESKAPGIWPEPLIPYQNSLCWREILSINDYIRRLATLGEAPLGGTCSCYPNKSQKSHEVAQRFLYAASRHPYIVVTFFVNLTCPWRIIERHGLFIRRKFLINTRNNNCEPEYRTGVPCRRERHLADSKEREIVRRRESSS
jgi:hypothetical protein